MGETSAISWTDATFNPWWGCVRVSPGCENCYAETFANRYGLAKWGAKEERRLFGDKHWSEPRKWNAKAEKEGVRRKVFCASMADVFEDRRDLDAQRERLWTLIRETPHLDWLLLTKRPENMVRLAPWEVWPHNVWAGTTAEDQKRLDERAPHLLRVPAVVRFLSCEPLLGALNLRGALGDLQPRVSWVIAGAESGHGARPMDEAWIRSLRDQCAGKAAFFYKQRIENGRKVETPELDGVRWVEFPEVSRGI